MISAQTAAAKSATTDSDIGNNIGIGNAPANGRRISVALQELTQNNINQLRRLNSVLFPIRYSPKIYRQLLESSRDLDYSRLALFNDLPVGGICCRYLADTQSLYIISLGVLAPYRRLGLGRMLVDHVIKMASGTAGEEVEPVKIKSVWLHVQTSNRVARQFYESCGFVADKDLVENYYPSESVKSAWIFRLCLLD